MLLPYAASVAEADARLAPRADDTTLATLAGAIPQEWVAGETSAYAEYLSRRLETPREFAEEAERARVA